MKNLSVFRRSAALFRLAGLILLLSPLYSSAEMSLIRPGDLDYPVEDARESFRQGNYEFVAVHLGDKVEIPGLNAEQLATVHSDYSVRELNYRWQTYDNIEDKPEKLFAVRRYCTRYNLMMVKLLKEKKRQDATRYRY